MDISVSGIRVKYGDKIVFDNYSATFREHEVNCIVGKSGSGKTTLLRLMLGTEKPLEGSVTGVPDKLSVVFQENRLAESRSPLANILAVTGKKKRNAAVALLEKMGISEPNRRTANLSGGEKRRVSMARALLHDAELYVFDEPFSSLDAETTAKVKEIMLEMTAGHTVIIAMHSADGFGANVITVGDATQAD